MKPGMVSSISLTDGPVAPSAGPGSTSSAASSSSGETPSPGSPTGSPTRNGTAQTGSQQQQQVSGDVAVAAAGKAPDGEPRGRQFQMQSHFSLGYDKGASPVKGEAAQPAGILIKSVNEDLAVTSLVGGTRMRHEGWGGSGALLQQAWKQPNLGHRAFTKHGVLTHLVARGHSAHDGHLNKPRSPHMSIVHVTIHDGNPVTGEGYKPQGGAAPMRNRVPPGGYSSGLW
ncbi:hypothetical protein FOCC_FOCC010800 [Frankliniella occidentalis]|nr:hypothetical protein FOCC_FOCC010800 [Frankliniella occidentalis]